MNVPEKLAKTAARLASDIDANALLVLTTNSDNCESFSTGELKTKRERSIKVIVATPDFEVYKKFQSSNIRPIKLTARPCGQMNQIYHAIACGMKNGFLKQGERLVCLTRNGVKGTMDSLMVMDVTGEELALELLDSNPSLSSTVELALKLGSESFEGKQVGAAFIVGDTKKVLRLSHQLMINPFQSHRVKVTDRRSWDLLEKYATFDGAFVVDNNGAIVAAHRFLDARTKVNIPKGLGTRHLAVATMTAATNAIGVTVSAEDRNVRIFKSGKLVAEVDSGSKIIECLQEGV